MPRASAPASVNPDRLSSRRRWRTGDYRVSQQLCAGGQTSGGCQLRKSPTLKVGSNRSIGTELFVCSIVLALTTPKECTEV